MKQSLGVFVVALLLLLANCTTAQTLEAGFRNPPNWARSWVYW